MKIKTNHQSLQPGATCKIQPDWVRMISAKVKNQDLSAVGIKLTKQTLSNIICRLEMRPYAAGRDHVLQVCLQNKCLWGKDASLQIKPKWTCWFQLISPCLEVDHNPKDIIPIGKHRGGNIMLWELLTKGTWQLYCGEGPVLKTLYSKIFHPSMFQTC